MPQVALNAASAVRADASSPTPNWAAVPTLSATVPVAGELAPGQTPTIVWYWKAAKVAALVFINKEENVDASHLSSHPLYQKLTELEDKIRSSIDSHRQTHADKDLVGALPIERIKESVDPGEYAQMQKEIEKFIEDLKTVGSTSAIGATSEPTVALGTAETAARTPASIEEFKELFHIIPLPDYADDFETDERFSKYRIAGPCPMTIRGVNKAELISLVGDRISDDAFNSILGTRGDSVEKAAEEGRLCVTNYRELSATDPVVVIGSSFVTDPIAVFAEPESGVDHIVPVAIQLGQDPVKSELLLANTPDKWRWQMAKTTVQVADGIYHEMVAHLAHTHLVMEAFSIAVQRNLDHKHPISRLLRPHIEGTNFINHAAATRLMAEDGPISNIFCNYSGSRIRSLQTLAVRARSGYDFEGHMPDNELASRNVSKLKVYPYREDALDIWTAILHWAKDYVDLHYEDDKAVEADAELASWSHDIKLHADMINFHEPRSKKVLTRTLAMIMFVASAQHAAINFGQNDILFAPAMAGAVWSDLPPADAGPAKKEQWLNMMPSLEIAKAQLDLLYLLGNVQYGHLGEYRSNVFPYCGTLETKADEALKGFREELAAIEVLIKRRNERRGYFAYTYLLPSVIPASINI